MKLLNVNSLPRHKRAKATKVEMEFCIGKQFGLRTILGIADPVPYHNGSMVIMLPQVLTRCECGLEAVVPWSAIKAGRRLACAACYPKLYKGEAAQ